MGFYSSFHFKQQQHTHSTVMAGLVRNCSRLLVKSGGVSSTSVRLMSGEAHEGGYKVWKNATYFICVPIIILANVNAFYLADHPKRPEFLPYEHLRIRTKKFPWGDGNHSFIHNPEMNALPDGYETEEPEHH